MARLNTSFFCGWLFAFKVLEVVSGRELYDKVSFRQFIMMITLPVNLEIFSTQASSVGVAGTESLKKLIPSFASKLLVGYGTFYYIWANNYKLDPPLWQSIVFTVAVYTFLGGMYDLVAICYLAVNEILYRVTGRRRDRLFLHFDAPFIAMTPREFWSRRWNLVIRDLLYRAVFIPSDWICSNWLSMPRRTSKLVSGFLVFLVSGLVHEWILFTSCAYRSEFRFGYQTTFFLVSSLVCALEATCLPAKWYHTTATRLPLRIALTACTMIFMLITSHLFWAPFIQCGTVQIAVDNMLGHR